MTAKGESEYSSLMYVPKNRAFVDNILLSSFRGATEHLLQQVSAGVEGEPEKWIIDNYIGLRKLHRQLVDELDEIETMLEVLEAKIG